MKSIVSCSAAISCVAVVLVIVGGCSDDESAPSTLDAGSSRDATTTSDAASPGSNDSGAQDSAGGACTTLATSGAQVVETAGAGAKPTATGGTLADGVYVLTKHEVYPPSSPDENTRKRTWRFFGGNVEAATDDASKAPVRAAGTFTAQDGEIRISVTCPQATQAVLPYTVSGSTLLMFDKDSPNDVYTYTKQ